MLTILKKGLLASLVVLLGACGGGGSSDGSDTPGVDNNVTTNTGGVKKYDLFRYMTYKMTYKPDPSTWKREYYEVFFYFEDGTPAWFNIIGAPVAPPAVTTTSETSENDDEWMTKGYSNMMVTRTLGILGSNIELSWVRFNRDNWGYQGDNPYFANEFDTLYLEAGKQTIKRWRENRGNTRTDDLTILDKYDWEIPRYIKNNEVIRFDSGNSYMLITANLPRTSSEEVCKYTFKDAYNLYNSVTHLAKNKLEKNVLIQTCHIYPAGSNISMGYRTIYYARDIGELHRVTSFGQGIVHHVIKKRKMYPWQP